MRPLGLSLLPVTPMRMMMTPLPYMASHLEEDKLPGVTGSFAMDFTHFVCIMVKHLVPGVPTETPAFVLPEQLSS